MGFSNGSSAPDAPEKSCFTNRSVSYGLVAHRPVFPHRQDDWNVDFVLYNTATVLVCECIMATARRNGPTMKGGYYRFFVFTSSTSLLRR